MGRLRSSLRALFRRSRFEHGMSDELRFHVDAYADDLRRSGMASPEAERRARAAFGSFESVREDCRRASGLRWWDELQQDVRYALRLMRRAPAFTTAIVLSLGLGIGATTAIFSLIDAVLLRSLPVANPEELFFLAHGDGDRPSMSANYPLFDRYRTVPSFSGVTTFRTAAFVVNIDNAVELAVGQYASGNYHSVIGAPFVLGRGFVSQPDEPADGDGIAVISESFWQRRFNRAPDILGRTIIVDTKAVSIVGVTRDVGFLSGYSVDVTLPLSMYVRRNPNHLTATDGFTSMPIVARLAPGVSAPQARAAADVAFQRFMQEPPVRWARKQSATGYTMARLIPAGQGIDDLRHLYRAPLLILIGMAGLALLVAIANVANLLLARAATQERETAIRLCIGSGRWRLVRQRLTESSVLSLAGGLLGVLLALWGTHVILAVFSTWQRRLALDVSPNPRVLLFATAVALGTGLAFGVLPALRSTQVDLSPSLRTSGAVSARRRRGGLSRALVIGQVALSVVALVTSALLTQSVHGLKRRTPGFDASDVLLFDVASYGVPLSDDDRRSVYSAILDRLAVLPGVTSVSLSTMTPLNTVGTYRGVVIPGELETPEARGVYANQVSEAYFRTIGVRLLQGRTFDAGEVARGANVVVLNARAARHIFKGANPIGQTTAWMSAQDTPLTVVGVVEDSSRESLRDDPPRMVYSPLTAGNPGAVQVAVKTTADPGPLVADVRSFIRRVNSNVVVDRVRTMEDQMNGSLVRERGLAWLASAFAALAATLSLVGLYGVMAYQVARRTRDIGIRLAIGARPGVVLAGVMRESAALTAAGLLVGLTAAWFATGVVSTFLHGLSPRDPRTLVGVAVSLLLIALAATYLPARRAARIDPLRALRTE
jgi:predicted permease